MGKIHEQDLDKFDSRQVGSWEWWHDFESFVLWQYGGLGMLHQAMGHRPYAEMHSRGREKVYIEKPFVFLPSTAAFATMYETVHMDHKKVPVMWSDVNWTLSGDSAFGALSGGQELFRLADDQIKAEAPSMESGYRECIHETNP